MIRCWRRGPKAGVDVRIIGKVEKGHDLTAEKYPGPRLHVRAIVRDGRAGLRGQPGPAAARARRAGARSA